MTLWGGGNVSDIGWGGDIWDLMVLRDEGVKAGTDGVWIRRGPLGLIGRATLLHTRTADVDADAIDVQ